MDLAQFGASGAIVVVVLLFLKFMREESNKNKETYDKVAAALHNVSWVTEETSKNVAANTKATQTADQYLKHRNGRDAKIHRELIRQVKQIPLDINRATDKSLEAYSDSNQKTLEAIKAIPETLKTIAEAQATAILEAEAVKKEQPQTIGQQTVKKQIVQNKE